MTSSVVRVNLCVAINDTNDKQGKEMDDTIYAVENSMKYVKSNKAKRKNNVKFSSPLRPIFFFFFNRSALGYKYFSG